ncbi:MAG: ATP-binding protein [Aeoliella sp.]
MVPSSLTPHPSIPPILGQDHVAEQFTSILQQGRLASTYLFIGPGGVGKRLFARQLSGALFCSQVADTALVGCGECQSCLLMAAGNHPDLLEVGLLKEKRSLLLEQFIGPDERRYREGLCHDLSLRPALASRRVAIIDHADTLSTVIANSLLKTLEEPPPRSLLILLGTSEAKQLPTIRSRAQVIRFAPLPTDVIERLVLEHEIASSPEMARNIAQLAEGSLDQARSMASEELWQLHAECVGLLSQPVIDSVRLSARVHEFSQQAGKEASVRRAALVAAISLCREHYRRELRTDPASAAAPGLLSRIDRCLRAEEQVDRNAHPQTVVQCWAEDLARA